MSAPTSRQGEGEHQRPRRGTPGFFSSARVYQQPVGEHLRPDELAGYYVDLRLKAVTPSWPPSWFESEEKEPFIYTAQWGLGAYERYLAGQGDEWRDAAVDAARHLVERQDKDGPNVGAFVHQYGLDHTFDVGQRWISAMAQGEAASLLVRAYAATGDDALAEAALLALRPMRIPLEEGGVRAELGDSFFLQEYPTDPPSHVLNGGIFALWGYRDVALGLGDEAAKREFEAGLESLARNLHRWDTGAWTRYDLYPFPVTNLASSFYHLLHIDQLRAMQVIAPRPEFDDAIERWEGYRASRVGRLRAFGHKAVFRILIPRTPLLGKRTPFRKPRRRE